MRQVRQHTLEHLDHYLAQFEREAMTNGSRVHFARDGDDEPLVLDICQEHRAQRIAKEQVHGHRGNRAERLPETGGPGSAGNRPGQNTSSSRPARPPATSSARRCTNRRPRFRELFRRKHDLGDRELAEVVDMVGEARQVLREHFLQAEVGIIGANALVAEAGYSMLVTNEGNGDLCANLPRVLIICTTLDRVLPRLEDATAMLRLLVRSATGQPADLLHQFYSGPRREQDSDGPLETHFILLDNRRSDILASDYREMLQCIRCGACLNHCPSTPVSAAMPTAGYTPAPMGSILTPLLTSLEQSAALPNACVPAAAAAPEGARPASPAGPAAGSAPRGKRTQVDAGALALGLKLHRLAGTPAAPVSRPHRAWGLAVSPARASPRPLRATAAGGRLDQPADFPRRQENLHAAVRRPAAAGGRHSRASVQPH